MNSQYWRQAVKDRDGWKCRVCGSTDRLQAHHLIPIHKNSSLALVVGNGITLCHKHHRIAHHGSYSGRKCAIMTNKDWFTPDAIAEVDAFINRAIEETIERDKAKPEG